jgi:hypothetical protein
MRVASRPAHSGPPARPRHPHRRRALSPLRAMQPAGGRCIQAEPVPGHGSSELNLFCCTRMMGLGEGLTRADTNYRLDPLL